MNKKKGNVLFNDIQHIIFLAMWHKTYGKEYFICTIPQTGYCLYIFSNLYTLQCFPGTTLI